jgi:putative ABC transport system permease protein
MRELLQALRFGLRALLRRPGLSAGVVLILGLGNGAAVTIFSTLDAFLLRPLPYPEPENLVWLRSSHGGNLLGVSHPDYLDWGASHTFQSLAKFNAGEYSVLNWKGEAECVLATRTTSNLFSLLGVRPLLGRPLSAAEDQPGSAGAVLLSHDLWRRRFRSDRHVLGASLRLDGASYMIVGVMPPGFHFPGRSDIWIPSSAWADQWPHRDIRVDSAVGRLAQGVPLPQARAALAAINTRLEKEYPATNSGIRADLVPMRDVWTGTSHEALVLLMAACGILLLIACANATSLLLIWADSREKELAIRMAFGIHPVRQLLQPLLEAIFLGLASGVAGLALALWGTRLVARLLPSQLPTWVDVRLDTKSFAAALLVSIAVGLLCAAAPAVRSLAVGPGVLLHQGTRTLGGLNGARALRRWLALAEIAVSLLLSISAGLLLKSLARLQHVQSGFETENVLTLEIHLPVFSLESYDQVRGLYRRLLDRAETLPGVIAVGLTTDLPLAPRDTWALWEFSVEGQGPSEQRRNPRARGHAVSAGYFLAMGIRIVRGRTFEPRDAEPTVQGAIVSRSFADRFWPGQNAVGKHFRLGGATGASATIVGVARDVRYESLASSSGLDVYFPLERLPSWPVHLVLKANEDPRNLVPALRREVRSVSADLGIRAVTPLAEQVTQSLWQQRIWATLLSVFSTVAILLAAAGIYGVTFHWVDQQAKEIGLRVALGAGRREILRFFLGEGIQLAATGIAMGLLGAYATGRALSSLLYGVRYDDPEVFSAAALTILSVALGAMSLPLARALRADPRVVLQSR